MKLLLLVSAFTLVLPTGAWAPSASLSPKLRFSHSSKQQQLYAATTSDEVPSEVDVIIIGSGLAGLSCGALLSHCNKNVVVLESHDAPGGAAHTWERRGFHFESGPSLFSGFSSERSPNPLKNIFQIVGEDCDWIKYDRWGTVLPNGERFAAKIGPEEFGDVLKKHGGPNAEAEFAALMERMKPISEAAQAMTSIALREDPAVLLTLLKYPKELLMTFSQGAVLTKPFSTIMDEMQIKDEFLRNWLDMLCFLLQGLPARGTLNTVISYMLADWYRPGVTLDYPRGGSGEIVNALVRAVRKNKVSKVCLNSHVEEILIEENKAVGVRLASGKVIRAKQAVVSNADPYITNQLLAPARSAGKLPEAMITFMDNMVRTDATDDTGGVADLKSFIHLHAGIDATGLPTTASADFPAQWAVIRDWSGEGVEAPRNIVLCSMPSLIDPAMAPDGKHVLHAYTPATEPCTYCDCDCDCD
jgi:phytoene dehydrogenase-like protein